MLASFVSAEVGIGLKAGLGSTKSDYEDLYDSIHSSKSYEDSSMGLFGVEVLYEQANLFNIGENNYLGVKAGFSVRGDEEIKIPGDTLTASYYEIPLTVYFKKAFADSKWSLMGGAGVAFGKATEETNYTEASVNKIFPFITAGAEVRFVKWFGLGLDLKYNFGAKMEEDGFVAKDVSGLEGAVAARFYF